MKKQILLLFLFLSSLTFAQQVKVEVDTVNIRIGEQFRYQISVDDTANVINQIVSELFEYNSTCC